LRMVCFVKVEAEILLLAPTVVTLVHRELHPEKYETVEPPPSQQQTRSSLTAAQLRRNSSSVATLSGASSKQPLVLARGASVSSFADSFSSAPGAMRGAAGALTRIESVRSINSGTVSAGSDGARPDSSVASLTGAGPPSLARLKSVNTSSRLTHQDSFASQTSQGSANTGMGASSAASIELRPVNTPKTPIRGMGRKVEPPKKKNNAKYLSTYKKETKMSPEVVAEGKRKKLNRQPCTLAYTAEGQLLVGYRSGGVLVYTSYEVYPGGSLRRLQVRVRMCCYMGVASA
jgi:hypothetical protein